MSLVFVLSWFVGLINNLSHRDSLWTFTILFFLDVCWGKLRFQFDGRVKEGSFELPVKHIEEEKFHSFPPDFYLEYWWYSSIIPLHEKIFSVRILFQKNNFHFHPFILRKLKEKRFPLNRNDDSINFLYHFQLLFRQCLQTRLPIDYKFMLC